MEGRTHRPVIDHSKCSPCSICGGGCPAEIIKEARAEEETLRGQIYRAGKIRPPTEEKTNWPPCRISCPLGQNIPGYIKLIAQKRFEEAVNLIRETNPLPSVCGLVCPRPCESVCLKARVDKPVAIRALKSFVVNRFQSSVANARNIKSNGIKVAVIGSGPAGLSVAYELALKGYQVEIIESHDQPGGMLAWAIPDFRLPKEVLRRDIDYIKNMGIKIRVGTLFGEDATLSDLKNSGAQAIVIATGTMKSVGLGIGNEEREGYFDCLSLFQNISHWRDILPGKKTLVVGGGNAALDAARTIARLGAKSVEILYRRSLEEMPADRDETRAALDEGVNIRFLTAPLKLKVSSGKLVGIQCVKTKLAAAEGSKRRSPVVIAGSDFFLKADCVVSAVGQTADYEKIALGLKLDLKSQKFPDMERLMFKGFDGVFGAGDFVGGPTNIVKAIAAGQKTAIEVDRYLKTPNTTC